VEAPPTLAGDLVSLIHRCLSNCLCCRPVVWLLLLLLLLLLLCRLRDRFAPSCDAAVPQQLKGDAAETVQDTKVVVDKDGLEWEEHVDKKSQRTFFFNRATGTSRWLRPETAPQTKTATAAAGAPQSVSAPAVPTSSASTGNAASTSTAPPALPGS